MNSSIQKLTSYLHNQLDNLNILKYKKQIKKTTKYLSILFAGIGIFIFFIFIFVLYKLYYIVITPSDIIDIKHINNNSIIDTDINIENTITIKKSLFDMYMNSYFNISKAINISKNISNFNINDYIFKVNNNINTAIKNSSINIYSLKNIYIPIDKSIVISYIDIPLDALSKSIEISKFNIDINNIVEKAIIIQQKILKVLSIDVDQTIKNMQQKYRAKGVDIYVNELQILREEALDHLRRIYTERNNAKQEYDTNYALQQQATKNLQKAIEYGNDIEARLQSEQYTSYALKATKAISDFKIYDRLYNDLSNSINAIRKRIEYINLKYIDIVL